MEHREKLHAVETAIRKALPRLMELTNGCKLEKDGYYYTYLGKFMVNASPHTDGYYLHHFSEDVMRKDKAVSFIYAIGDKRFEHYKIVGHDIQLNDVLEWLEGVIAGNYIINLQTNGVLVYEYYSELTRSNELIKSIDVNLSKPRLADQSEEFINFLYNFVKEN